MPTFPLRQRVGATSVTASIRSTRCTVSSVTGVVTAGDGSATQTFRTTTGSKRPQNSCSSPSFHGLLSCSCLRQIAETLNSPQTVAGHAPTGATCQFSMSTLGTASRRPAGVLLVRVQPVSSHPYCRAEELLPAWVHGHRAAPFGNDDEGAASYRREEKGASKADPAHEKPGPNAVLIQSPRPQSRRSCTRRAPRLFRVGTRTHHTISSRAGKAGPEPERSRFVTAGPTTSAGRSRATACGMAAGRVHGPLVLVREPPGPPA